MSLRSRLRSRDSTGMLMTSAMGGSGRGRGRGLGGNPRNWRGEVDLYTALGLGFRDFEAFSSFVVRIEKTKKGRVNYNLTSRFILVVSL